MNPGGFKPFVPEQTNLREFTFKAVFLGVAMAIALGAANAYLALKAGMTVAATFPAAVVGMAVLRVFKGSILEENLSRTIASVGEVLAVAAIFTIPPFFMAGVWPDFSSTDNYLIASSMLLLGGTLGVLFLTILRRVFVNDTSLPFPESVAAAAIHEAGSKGSSGAKYLFSALGFSGLIQLLASMKLFAVTWKSFIPFANIGVTLKTALGELPFGGNGGLVLSLPAVSSAFIGVGYIIGPQLATLLFSGGLLAWGLIIPVILFVRGQEFAAIAGTDPKAWLDIANQVWFTIVRPMAIGGMFCGIFATLYKMRKQLFGGLRHAFGDLKKTTEQRAQDSRYEKDISFRIALPIIIIITLVVMGIYYMFCKNLTGAVTGGLIMVVAGFILAAISGYITGLVGSSSNPVSGLTAISLIIAALSMVFIGLTGVTGITAVLSVAVVVCAAITVASDMLQDLKIGQFLGGTPWKMELGEILGVVAVSFLLFIIIAVLHQGDINMGGAGLGGEALPAPQASMITMLAKAIVGGQMAWSLMIIGFLAGLVLMVMGVKGVMVIAIAMYLPFYVSFAVVIGGVMKALSNYISKRKKLNEDQMGRVDNIGILIASGLVAGEAIVGVIIAIFAYFEWTIPTIFKSPSIILGMIVMAIICLVLILIPLRHAGREDEAAPPSLV